MTRIRWLAILTTLLVFVVLAMPGTVLEAIRLWVQMWLPWKPSLGGGGEFPTDKVVHALLFAIVAAFTARGWRNSFGVLAVVLYMMTLGVASELIQFFVPGRSADILDVVADLTGSVIGVVYGYFFWGNKKSPAD